ncbi:MAG: hypothetical protein LQ337_007582, partial [Flavoplaca oasis]
MGRLLTHVQLLRDALPIEDPDQHPSYGASFWPSSPPSPSASLEPQASWCWPESCKALQQVSFTPQDLPLSLMLSVWMRLELGTNITLVEQRFVCAGIHCEGWASSSAETLSAYSSPRFWLASSTITRATMPSSAFVLATLVSTSSSRAFMIEKREAVKYLPGKQEDDDTTYQQTTQIEERGGGGGGSITTAAPPPPPNSNTSAEEESDHTNKQDKPHHDNETTNRDEPRHNETPNHEPTTPNKPHDS